MEKPLATALNGAERRDNGGTITNVQYTLIRIVIMNPLYNKYILIKNYFKKQK
jgi:hypothetical protein